MDMGRLDEVEAIFDRSLGVAREHGDLEVQCWGHYNHVRLARSTGERGALLAHATQAYEIAERIGDAFSRVSAGYWLGYAHFMLGESGEAISLIERSIELGREARTGLEDETVRLAGLSEALLSIGDAAGALRAAEEAVQVGQERGTEGLLAVGYRALAEAHLASGDPAEAREALDRADRAAEATGFRAEADFIERTRSRLTQVR
jgi:tetratricopeptide (TPR) repeat protein